MNRTLEAFLLHMLKELDIICRENGITYVLANHSAWDAVKFGRYHEGMFDTTVLMERTQFHKFQSLNFPDVSLKVVPESCEGLEARLIDEDTVMLDYRNPKRYKIPAAGIGITVADITEDSAEIRKVNGTKAFLPADIFDRIIYLTLEGEAFPVFEDFDRYFSVLVSENWRGRNWPHKVTRKNIELIFSEDVSYKEYMKRPVVKKSLWPLKKSVRAAYYRWRRETWKPAVKDARKYKFYLYRTGDRFSLWEEYYPVKAELLKLSEEGRTEELEERLKDYFKITEYYYKRNLGFSFDEEILQIALPILEKNKSKAYVDKLIKMIPKAYRSEHIEEILRSSGVEHPLLNDL